MADLNSFWTWFGLAVVLVAIAVAGMYFFSRRHQKEQLTPLNNLEQEYHKGMITEEEYHRRRKKLLEADEPRRRRNGYTENKNKRN